MEQFPLVCVEWYDAYSTDAWTPIEELQASGNKPCRTVGYCLLNNDTMIVVASTSDGADACCTMHIDKRMVEKIHFLHPQEDVTGGGGNERA